MKAAWIFPHLFGAAILWSLFLPFAACHTNRPLKKGQKPAPAQSYFQCMQSCQRRHAMEAVSWQMIESQCKMQCACPSAQKGASCAAEGLRCAPYHKDNEEKSYRLLCLSGAWKEIEVF